jgi:phage terminase large subunit-like protein
VTTKKTTTPPKSTSDPVTQYALDVIEGREIAGPLVRAACKRHQDDLESGPARGLEWRWLDDKGKATHGTGAHAVNFFGDVLRLAGGEYEGNPFILHPSQVFIVGSLFGWINANGFRRYRVAYIEEGKGSGKSPLAAGIGLYMMTADKEQRAEVYAAAFHKEQATVLFRDAVAMRDQSPALERRIESSGGRGKEWNLAHLESGSFFRPISSESQGRGKSGPRPHCVLLDELHEHATPAMVNFMSAGRKNRRQPLIVEITNSGSDRTTICWSHHEYSEKVVRGIVANDTWFAYVCGLDVCESCLAEGHSQPQDGCKDCDDWRDRKVWKKSVPTLGVSLDESYLAEQVALATGIPTQENIVKRLNFCIWTESVKTWITSDAWNACPQDAKAEELLGRVCCGGLDLSATEALSSLVLAFPPATEDEPWKWLCWFWMPKELVAERQKKDKVPYQPWIDVGLIEDTPGDIIDYDVVRARIRELSQRYAILEIAYDRWNATQLVTQLQGDGLQMRPFGQGYQYISAPMKEVEALVRSQSLDHGGNPVLAWCVSNVHPDIDAAGNIKTNKGKSTGRIDGAQAGIMALGRAMLADPNAGKSVYDTPGFESVMV